MSDICERDKVIIGADGWLFLGNDSNNGVAQFMGELNLSKEDVERFKAYLTRLKKRLSCEFFFSISPNKEFVRPEKYPFVMREKRNGNLLLHEQILDALEEEGVSYTYPVVQLSETPYSYYKTDTHWSEYGAYISLKEFLRAEYGIALVELAGQQFVMRNVAGDLGSKIGSEKDGRLSYNFEVDEYEVFNSGLKNHGFVAHYVNKDALDGRSVLVFGDSFGISYIKAMVLTFREVVYLYSPATFIEDVFECVDPDLVVCQINQRFLLKPPVYREKLVYSRVVKKISQFGEQELQNYIQAKKIRYKDSRVGDFFLAELSIKRNVREQVM